MNDCSKKLLNCKVRMCVCKSVCLSWRNYGLEIRFKENGSVKKDDRFGGGFKCFIS